MPRASHRSRRGLTRLRGGRLLLVLAAAGCALLETACHVFTGLEDCQSDADCGAGERCEPEGRFCERDTRPVVIGVSLSEHGEFQSQGEGAREGLELAESVINGSTRLLGRGLHLEIVDDESDAATATQIAKDFEAEGAAALIGPYGHALATKIAPATQDAKLLEVAPTLASVELACSQPAEDRYFFSLVPTNGTSAGMSLLALDGLPGKESCTEAVLVRADDALGQAFEDALPPLYTSGGGHVLAVLQITAEPTLDYTETIDALVAAQPQCIFLAAYGRTTVALMEQLLMQQPTFSESLAWIGGPYTTRDDFLQGSSALPSLPGVVYGVRQTLAPATPEFATFRELYLDHYGLPADTVITQNAQASFDAVMLAALSLESTGAPGDGARIRDGLWNIVATTDDHVVFGPGDVGDAVRALEKGKKIHYKGASSSMTFSEYGAVIASPQSVFQIAGGEVLPAYDYPEASVRDFITKTQEQLGDPCMK